MLCIVGFENNLVQIFIMIRRYVVIKNHITRLKVKVTGIKDHVASLKVKIII